MLKRNWWKALCAVMLMYTVIAGFLVEVPSLGGGNLYQSIRNVFYHVPMWFTMMFMLIMSVCYSVAYLATFKEDYDLKAVEFAKVGVLFSLLGMVTGIEWSNVTWSSTSSKIILWTSDAKQICAAIEILIYLAYFVLRNGIKDDDKRGRIGAVYNIFAFAMMFPLLLIIPRMSNSSSHPGGTNSNIALDPKDATMAINLVKLPAYFGWIMMGFWLANIKIRMRRIGLGLDHAPLPRTTKAFS